MVKQRRAALREMRLKGSSLNDSDDTWGIALSGGGIRSATFCFGLLHAFAAQRMLLRFDVLSTVSGGGYIGSMLGRLFHRAAAPADALAIEQALARGNNSWFAWWLRANGRYLVPQGLRDSFFALAVYLRNLLGIHLELGLVGLVFGALLAGMDLFVWWLASLTAGGWWPAIEWAHEWIIWVPTVFVALPPMGGFALALCWSFWMIPWMSERFALLGWVVGTVALASVVMLFNPRLALGLYAWAPRLMHELLAIAIIWLIAVLVTAVVIRRAARSAKAALSREGPETPAIVETQDGARNAVTKLLSMTIRAMAWVVLIGAIDRTAWWLAFEVESQAGIGYALAIAAAALRVLLSPVSGLRQAAGGSNKLITALGIAGRVLTFCLFVWWVAIVHRTALAGIFGKTGVDIGAAIVPLSVIAVSALAYIAITGTDMRFLNLSSLHGFYRARLVRSYLGSVNPWRFLEAHNGNPDLGAANPLPQSPEDSLIREVGDVDPRDDLPLHQYEPHRNGGPVHLINTCLNETTDPRGGLFNRDRRGRLLTVGPHALLRVGSRNWQRIRPEQGDPLTLGSWMAISGAAVSPGLGSATRGGVSALAMFAGARLGYWWDSIALGERPSTLRKPWSKATSVLRETFGIFGGPNARDWYLTDGGHFENTGAYALLRERTRVIIVADCGADPTYRFGDLENLVRKARIDLGADIEFLRPTGQYANGLDEESQRFVSCFGSLNDLASNVSDACFALARVSYGDLDAPGDIGASIGYLILIKPNLCSGLPVDLFNFKAENFEFPQQSTADQFFDEAQWESYFQLGNALGQRFSRERIVSLLTDVADLFVRDDGSPLESEDKRASPNNVDAAPVPTGRLPARFAGATASLLGLGAISGLSVALWQAIEAVKSAHELQVKDERSALKELTDLWAKMSTDPETRATTANALAATLARVSATLCTGGDAGWFNRSPLAVDLLTDTLKACGPAGNATTPRACEWLMRAVARDAEGARSSCLMAGRTIAEQQLEKEGCAVYWAYDYRAHALSQCAHPVVLTARGGAVEKSAKLGGATEVLGPLTLAEELRSCEGRSVVPMIYGNSDVAALQRYTAVWTLHGLAVERARDLEALAHQQGRSSPWPVEVTTVRYRDSASAACAQALPRLVGTAGWHIEMVSESKNTRAGILEVWLAPGSSIAAAPAHAQSAPAGAKSTAGSASSPAAGSGQTSHLSTASEATQPPPSFAASAPSPVPAVPRSCFLIMQGCGCATGVVVSPPAARPSHGKGTIDRTAPRQGAQHPRGSDRGADCRH
jgi:hypothetical protein